MLSFSLTCLLMTSEETSNWFSTCLQSHITSCSEEIVQFLHIVLNTWGESLQFHPFYWLPVSSGVQVHFANEQFGCLLTSAIATLRLVSNVS